MNAKQNILSVKGELCALVWHVPDTQAVKEIILRAQKYADAALEDLKPFSEKITDATAEESNLDDPHFDGAAVEKKLDQERLTKGLFRVFDYMHAGHWLTITEIARGAEVPENSASAHMRSLRKARWGSHTVERMRVTESGLFKYRLVPNKDSLTYAHYLKDSLPPF